MKSKSNGGKSMRVASSSSGIASALLAAMLTFLLTVSSAESNEMSDEVLLSGVQMLQTADGRTS